MYILLLIWIIPSLVLLAVLGFLTLILAAAAVIEFPLVLLMAVGLLGFTRHLLPKLNKKPEVLGESM